MTTAKTMTRLIARSSLGTPAARALRARTPRSTTHQILTKTATSNPRGTRRPNP